MTKTQTFRARLPDGSTKMLECRWLECAEQYIGRYNQGSYYFERDGTQI